MIRSVYYNQEDILRGIVSLHCPDGFDCDITYGNGSFYKNLPEPRLKFDIDPQKEGVRRACSTNLPLESDTVSSIVFDPPFLTYVKAAREHDSIMAKRFGGYWRYDELEKHYKATIKEVGRVLVLGGVLVVKCQDIIHNHSLHCTHANVIGWADEEGLRIADLFVLPAKARMPMPEKDGEATRIQRHARIYHSYFLVFKQRRVRLI